MSQFSIAKHTPIIGSSHRGPEKVANWKPLTTLLSNSLMAKSPESSLMYSSRHCHTDGRLYPSIRFNNKLGPQCFGPNDQIRSTVPCHFFPALVKATFKFVRNSSSWDEASAVSLTPSRSSLVFPDSHATENWSKILINSVWPSKRLVTSSGNGRALTLNVLSLLDVLIVKDPSLEISLSNSVIVDLVRWTYIKRKKENLNIYIILNEEKFNIELDFTQEIFFYFFKVDTNQLLTKPCRPGVGGRHLGHWDFQEALEALFIKGFFLGICILPGGEDRPQVWGQWPLCPSPIVIPLSYRLDPNHQPG